MVSVKVFVASLAPYAAIFAVAAPTTTTGELEERAALKAQASIYMCSGTRWTGTCRNVLVNIDECVKVPNGWNNRIRSIRNDSKAVYRCTWYTDSSCNGRAYKNQEDANLSDGDGHFDRSITTYSCQRK
ncbi:hypothetical protein B0H63DRAFT_473027 [Podospora didyma]|uniref:Uncharacterized protein n=1 Tax=Podospora didyma TaxID=330526 RepID=A0AAE0NPV4_9PEZI|nr:hypothetical protein B0H63DRAFT_473027 [Podospora didyma]